MARGSRLTAHDSRLTTHDSRPTTDNPRLPHVRPPTGDDLLYAMGTLGFEKYVEPLKAYLSKYRESIKGEKPEKGKMKRDGVSRVGHRVRVR